MAAEDLPIAETTPTTTNETAPLDDGILSLFGVEPTEDDVVAAVPEPEAASTPETPETTGDEWSFDRIEDEKAWTPEKTSAAVAFLREQRTKLEKHWGVSKKKREEVEHDRRELAKAQQQFELRQRTVDANVAMLFRGTARERLDALGALTGRPPAQALEELNFGIATDGKQESPNREVAELRQQLEEMRTELKRRKEEEGAQTQVERVRSGCRQAVKDAERWPEAAERSKADPDGAARQLFAYLERNPGVTVATAMDRIELELLRAKGKHAQTERGVAPTGTAGAKTARGAAASRSATKPKEETRTEPMTDRERIKSLEQDVDQWFGLG